MTNNTYDCQVCLSLNHSSRLQCSYCGTTPASYSVIGRPSILNRDFQNIEVVAAYGVSRAVEHHAAKLWLRTVELTHYAESK